MPERRCISAELGLLVLGLSFSMRAVFHIGLECIEHLLISLVTA